MSITVTDSVLSVTTSFLITVVNLPPRFTSTMPDRLIPLNSIGTYDLTTYFVDDDGNPLFVTATSSFAGATAIAIPTGILTQPAWATI
jgi:hypothetical protein